VRLSSGQSGVHLPGFEPREDLPRDPDLEQWMTPSWTAEALIERHYPHLSSADVVLEAGCGTGRWLRVLAQMHPAVRAIGVEIDPRLVADARAAGCEVVEGDYARVELAVRPTLVLGNWPFGYVVFSRFLARSHALLPEGGECGILTTSRTFQSTATVLERLDRWSMSVELLPREIFGHYPNPLVFGRFVKDRQRRLWGLALFDASAAARQLRKRYRTLAEQEPTTWRAVVFAALERLGGSAALPVLYAEIEQHRPTPNQWWREKVRQVLQRHARSLGRAEWALP
jgi:SAM-dependent methyltransferase